MKRNIVVLIGSGALAAGFCIGLVSRPILFPAPVEDRTAASVPAPPLGVDQPTQEEATQAVRRHRVGYNSYPQATLILGECSPGGLAPGVTCAARVVLKPDRAGATAQTRSIGFARIEGQWEVSLW